MNDIEMRTYRSLGEFATRVADFLRPPPLVLTLLRMDGLFREKVILAVSITNNCFFCTTAHTALGRALGMTDEDIHKLVALARIDFPHKEWLALNYARQRAVLRGREPAGEDIDAYRRHYSPRERAHIDKIIRMMLVANYTSNLVWQSPCRDEWQEARKPAGGLSRLLRTIAAPAEGLVARAVTGTRATAGLGMDRAVCSLRDNLGLAACNPSAADQKFSCAL